MRLLDILLEAGGLEAILNTPNSISAFEHLPEQAKEIKRLLSAQTLVTGITNGQFTTNGKAWNGPIDEEWNEALSNAIRTWKQSVNIQLQNAGRKPELDTAGPGVIHGTDLKFLLNPGNILNAQGILRLRTERTDQNVRPQAPPFQGQTYVRQLGSTNAAEIQDIKSMVLAIGWSGWYRLSWAVADLMNMNEDSNTRNRWAQRFILECYSNFRVNSYPWIDNWNKNHNTLGGQDRIVNNVNLKLDIRSAPVDIYNKFAPLLLELWADDEQKINANKERAEQAETGVAVTSDDVITNIARNLQNAMEGMGTDEDAIATELGRLQSKGDWDNLTQRYNDLTQRTLHEDLYSELDEDPQQYLTIVTSNLMRLNVINPLLLHSLLNFGTQSAINISLDGKNYSIAKDRQNNKVLIEGYDGFDDIVIDQILRSALEKQGTEVPVNLRPEVDSQDREQAAASFIAAIEASYPEMVPWYTYQTPFNEPDPNGMPYPDLGGLRLKGIISQAGQLIAVGSSSASVLEYIKEEIKKDREWLIGTSENNPGIANIRFAERWQTEGNLNDRFFPELSDDDLIDLNEDEQELFDALVSEQEELRAQAVNTILNSGNREDLYVRLYGEAAKSNNSDEYLDSILGDEDTVKNYIMNADLDDSLLSRIIPVLQVATAAPRKVAELFKEAAEFGFTTGATDDELMTKLIDNIKNRNHYNLVDARYRELDGVTNSLLEDMGNEQWLQRFGNDTYYNRLASIIGATEIALVSAEVSSRLRNTLNDVAEELNEETIQALETDIGREGTIPFRKIQPLVNILDEIVETHTTEQGNADPNYLRLMEIRNAFMNYYRQVRPRGRPGINAQSGPTLSGNQVLELASEEPPAGMKIRNGRDPSGFVPSTETN